MLNFQYKFATNSRSNVSKKNEVILIPTDFAKFSGVSRNTVANVANSILTNSSVLTRIWVTVIFIKNDMKEGLRMSK